MKSIFCLTLSLFLLIFTSCTKSNNPPNTNNVVSVDSLLDNKIWEVEHILWTQDNILYHYDRGAIGNSQNFDYDYLQFKKDSTGSYTTSISTYNLTWMWTDQIKSKLTYIIHDYDHGASAPGKNFTVNLEDVNVTDSTLRDAGNYTNIDDGTSVVTSETRIPVASIQP